MGMGHLLLMLIWMMLRDVLSVVHLSQQTAHILLLHSHWSTGLLLASHWSTLRMRSQAEVAAGQRLDLGPEVSVHRDPWRPVAAKMLL